MKKVLFLFLLFFSSVQSWVQFQNNPAHTGKTETVVQVETLLWSKQIPPISPLSGPAVKDSLIFIPTSSGLYCFSTNGDSLWAIPGSFENVPAIIGDSVLIVSSNIFLYAFSLRGDSLWRLTFRDHIWHPTVWDSFIFITEGNRLWKISISGQIIWGRQCPPGFYNDAPAIDDSGRIFVATLADPLGWFDFRVYGFNQNGDQIFFYEGSRFPFVEPGGNQVTPTITPTGIVFATYPQTGWFHGCYLVQFTGGSTRWEGTMWHASASCDVSRIYHIDNNTIVARDLAGNQIWRSAHLGTISYSSPAVDGEGKIFVGTNLGIFYILNPEGMVNFSYDTGSGILTHPAISPDGKVIIASTNRLFCFGQRSVAIRESLAIGENQSRVGIYNISGQQRRQKMSPGVYFEVFKVGGKKVVKKIIKFH